MAESTLTFQNGGEALTEGLKEYTRGVEAAGDGARELDEGAGKLADAAGQLSDGAGSLKNGADTLNDGLQAIVGESHGQSQALTDGARSLSEGLAAFSGALSQMPASSDLSGYAQQMKEASAALGGAPAASDPSYLAGQIEAAVEAKDTEQLAALAQQALQEAQVNYQSAQTMSSQVSQAQTALSPGRGSLVGGIEFDRRHADAGIAGEGAGRKVGCVGRRRADLYSGGRSGGRRKRRSCIRDGNFCCIRTAG